MLALEVGFVEAAFLYTFFKLSMFRMPFFSHVLSTGVVAVSFKGG